MILDGEIVLQRGLDGRWYLMHLAGYLDTRQSVLGHPNGYETHIEGAKWRTRFQTVQQLQQLQQTP